MKYFGRLFVRRLPGRERKKEKEIIAGISPPARDSEEKAVTPPARVVNTTDAWSAAC